MSTIQHSGVQDNKEYKTADRRKRHTHEYKTHAWVQYNILEYKITRSTRQQNNSRHTHEYKTHAWVQYNAHMYPHKYKTTPTWIQYATHITARAQDRSAMSTRHYSHLVLGSMPDIFRCFVFQGNIVGNLKQISSCYLILYNCDDEEEDLSWWLCRRWGRERTY
jgi:hypothetical protein